MSGITFAQMLAASPAGIRTVGAYFEDPRKDYASAEHGFDTRVANRIRSGHSWKGEGVPDATMVAETNASALAVAKLVTEAASLALDGLAGAVDTAQRTVHETIRPEAAAHHVVINDDGSTEVSPDLAAPTQPGVPDPNIGQRATARVRAEKIEREIKGCLAFVAVADQSCSGMLGKLRELSPQTTATADPQALAHNRFVLAGALANRNLAQLTRDFWDAVTPKAVPNGADASKLGNIALDVIGITAAAAGVASSLGEDATGLGAVLGGVQGVAAGSRLLTGFQKLAADAKKNSGDADMPVPPGKGDELLNDVYLHGRASGQDLEEGGQPYTPDSPSTRGLPPKYDENGVLVPYKEFAHVGSRSDSSGEMVVVDERNGHTYYSDDNGHSFLPVG